MSAVAKKVQSLLWKNKIKTKREQATLQEKHEHNGMKALKFIIKR